MVFLITQHECLMFTECLLKFKCLKMTFVDKVNSMPWADPKSVNSEIWMQCHVWQNEVNCVRSQKNLWFLNYFKIYAHENGKHTSHPTVWKLEDSNAM